MLCSMCISVFTQADMEDSKRFVVPLLPKRAPGRTLRGLDVGAGIGRITGGLLLELCDTVDLLEGARNYVAKAKEQLSWAGDRVERYICEGMQIFTPEAGRRARRHDSRPVAAAP